jgi:hypothetical protein
MDEDEGGPHNRPSVHRDAPPRPPRPPPQRRGGGPPQPQTQHDKVETESSSQASRRRPRPGRAERQRRKNEAENGSTPTTEAVASHLNPTAPDFVPQIAAVSTETSVSAPSQRGRGRGGRRGRQPVNGKEKEMENVPDITSQTPSTRGRPRRNENQAKFRVAPKVIKESEDLMLRMTDALIKGEYDCSICTDKVHSPKMALLTGDPTIQTRVVMQNLLGRIPPPVHQEMGIAFPWRRVCMALSRLSIPQ